MPELELSSFDFDWLLFFGLYCMQQNGLSFLLFVEDISIEVCLAHLLL